MKKDPNALIVKLKAGLHDGRPNVIIVRYHPGFKEAYGIVSQADGDDGPLELTTFGDDSFSQRQLRKAWRDWERTGDDTGSAGEWTPKSAVAAFVRWINSGGEARLAHAREARRHGVSA